MAKIKKDPKFEGVHEWFPDWLDNHVYLFDKPYWPKPNTERYDATFKAWKNQFIKKGLHDKDLAYEISEEMTSEPPEHLDQHLPAILTLAARVYRERNLALKGDPNDGLAVLKELSRDCEYCTGQGFATLWHAAPDEVRAGYKEYSTSAWCVCRYGQWIQNYYRTKNVDGMGKLPSVADVIEKRSHWLLQKPGYDQLEEFQGRGRKPAAVLDTLVGRLAGETTIPPKAGGFRNPPPGTQGRLPALPSDKSPAY